MTIAYHISTVLSIGLFLWYGGACLVANGMAAEFRRFGLSRYRTLTGALEVLGAIGLAAGYALPIVGVFSAVGLATLMLLGVVTRIRVRDSILESAPAAFLLFVNLFIAYYAWQHLPRASGSGA